MSTLMWFAADMAKQKGQERDKKKALDDLFDKYRCKDCDGLVEKGKRGELETYHEIADWDTLAWSPAKLGKRNAIPLGMTRIDVNWGYPKRKGPVRLVDLFLYAVPPPVADPNFYSMHCSLDSGTTAANLEGVVDVARLVSLRWVTGMGNGVRAFSLGPQDRCQGLHEGAQRTLADLRAALAPVETNTGKRKTADGAQSVAKRNKQ